jgi:hypothetical protein
MTTTRAEMDQSAPIAAAAIATTKIAESMEITQYAKGESI